MLQIFSYKKNKLAKVGFIKNNGTFIATFMIFYNFTPDLPFVSTTTIKLVTKYKMVSLVINKLGKLGRDA